MSDSIARSTGAVYRRAWRQVLYAALVLLGSWIGQYWGIVGVAWGALAALTINFLTMAELSLSVAGIPWATFWRAHVPAVWLTLGSFPIVWASASLLRQWSLPPLATLGLTAIVAGAVVLVLSVRAPNLFLGPDGRWILEAFRRFLPRRVVAPAAAGGIGIEEST
jgi:hypothetical protein